MKLGSQLFAKSSLKNKAQILAPLIGLTVMTFIAYLPSLSIGFISDDFSQYAYFYQKLHGESASLLANLTGPWMQDVIQDMHWRPLMLIPHLYDCMLWNFSAIGYHLTNILLHCACVVLTYLVAKTLQTSFKLARGLVLPTTAAALFAIFPTLTEAVSWISGRVDPCFTCTYLLAFLFFLHAQNSPSQRLYMISLLFTACAFLTKENSITLPFLMVWFLVCKNFSGKSVLKITLKALHETRTYWALAIFYLAARTLALGTFVGGYLDSADTASSNQWIANLLNPLVVSQLFVPVANDIANESLLRTICSGLLTASIALGFGNLVFNKFAQNLVRIQVFAFGWTILSFSIVAKVWSFGSVISGGRHTYLLSIPLCIWLACALLAKNEPGSETENSFAKRSLRNAAAVVALTYLATFFYLCTQHQALWQVASNQTKIFKQSVIEQADLHRGCQRLSLLDPPVVCGDINLFCRFNVLRDCFKKPFVLADLSEKIETPRPYLAPSDLLRKTALRATLAESPEIVALAWHRQFNIFEKKGTSEPDTAQAVKNLSIEAELTPLSITPDGTKCFTLRQSNDVSPPENAFDTIEITASCDATDGDTALNDNDFVEVHWSDDKISPDESSKLLAVEDSDGTLRYFNLKSSMKPATGLRIKLAHDGETHKYLFHISEFSTWLLKEDGKRPKIKLVTHSANSNIQVTGVRLNSLAKHIPKLSTDQNDYRRNLDGTLSHSYHNCPLQFSYDARLIEGAKTVQLTVSAPNQLSEPSRTSYRQKILNRNPCLKVQSRTAYGKFNVDKAQLPISANYEVTVSALDSNGNMIGYRSEPLILRFNR